MSSRWDLRRVSADLEQQWLADGLWDDRTLGQLIDEGLASNADAKFQIHSATRPWVGTFGGIREESLRLAGALRERGIGPGDAIAFQLPNWVEAAMVFYAATYLGAVVVPIVHFYGPNEVGYILRRTGVRAFVTASRFGAIDYLANLERLRPELDEVELVAAVGLDGPIPGLVPFESLAGEPLDGPIPVEPTDPALIAYTSGTTAEPKGVIHSHRTIGCEIRQLAATQHPASPPNLVGAPVGHAIGMLAALLLPLRTRTAIHLVDVWDPPRLLELMLEHRISCGTGATFFLTSLLDQPTITDEHRALMAYIGLGGAPVPAAVADRATAEGISIVRMYGSTEHPSITGGTHDDPLEKRLHTDGHALPGVELRLVDEDGNPVPAGAPGEILSRGPDCCVGYTDASLTAAAFDDDGWYHTGDVGILDADGFVQITDRKSDVIIRGGENVSAAAVEEVLAAVPAIAEVAVVGAPDERFGERVCAVVRCAPGVEPPDLDALRAATEAAGLARQKWPESVVVVADFPRTPSGKIKKAELRRSLQA